MENKQKIVVGVVLTLIGCVATPLAFHYLGGNQPKVDVEALNKEFNTILQNKLAEQKQQLEKEYNNKITQFENMTDEEKRIEQENILKNRRITEKLKEVILKYYKNGQERELLVYSIDGNELVTTLKFDVGGKGVAVVDNEKNISNMYSINHTNSRDTGKEKIVEKNEITFKVITSSQDKFDIANSKLMLDYFNMLIGRDLTEEEKTALNIQANMNLNELSSIKDLNMYIYNGDSLKIGDFIFKCEKGKVGDTQKNYFEYTITSHTITEVPKEEEKQEEVKPEKTEETTETETTE